MCVSGLTCERRLTCAWSRRTSNVRLKLHARKANYVWPWISSLKTWCIQNSAGKTSSSRLSDQTSMFRIEIQDLTYVRKAYVRKIECRFGMSDTAFSSLVRPGPVRQTLAYRILCIKCLTSVRGFTCERRAAYVDLAPSRRIGEVDGEPVGQDLRYVR